MKPSVGRIVHYIPQDEGWFMPEEVLPAMITAVFDENTVSLQVFANNHTAKTQYRAFVTNDSTRSASYWKWPERIEDGE